MIRLLENKDMAQAAAIVATAYPGMNISQAEQQAAFAERLTDEQADNNDLRYYGLFQEEEKLVGLYRLHDFKGNVNGKLTRVFGIGMVAVHFFHKKEKIAYYLLKHFQELAINENVFLTALYPFNPVFYKKMGYGYGPTRYEYKVKPDSFPNVGNKKRVELLSPSDEELIVQLYNEYVIENHGMIERTWSERNLIKKKASYYAGVFEEGKLAGAIAYALQPVKESHFLHHELVVYEWFWKTPSAFLDICSWLNSQQDQVDRIVVRTHDESFMFQLGDPRNNSNHLIPSVFHEVATVGSGLMYKLVSVEGFVEGTGFKSLMRPEKGEGIVLYVKDSFLQQQEGAYRLSYTGEEWVAKKASIDKHDADLIISIDDLSSWWMGCVSLEKLVQYGKINMEKSLAKELDSWFMPKSKPICSTSF